MPEAAMSDKEVEASLSLLGMMQQDTTSKGRGATSGGGLSASLMQAVATEAAGGDQEHEVRRHAQLSSLSRELTLEELRAHFGKPIVQVAKEFGICTTFLKKICRRCGIKRWPHRQIRSLARTIQMLRQLEAQAESPADRAKYAAQIAQMEAKQRAVFENPDVNGKLKRVKKYSSAKAGGGSGSTAAARPKEQQALDQRLVMAASALSANMTLMLAKPLALGVQIPSTDTVTNQFTTPIHSAGASAASPPPVGLISPSNRKVASLAKAGADAEQRLRSASIGSLHDDDVVVEA